ncbi:histone-lysine N-methyltransferase SETMAR-like [Octopus sinensis]|uniref:Histone-lysine N-methyltransferase SETMAR-like n=1 Tax=Octopus sinensis TaxID=2607531 RepID=A0A7E6EXI0_9MOLL|nr:histone-lysine N-methyltransferase SETMAR-like [Octopus sinensis]
MLKIKENEIHFHNLMLFCFRKGKNAAQIAKKICAVYRDGIIAANTVRKWFARFRTKTFDLENRELSGRPTVVDNEQIKTLIKNNSCHITQDNVEILHISYASIIKHLKTFD